MSRDPVRLAMGGPAGARLARAMRASRETQGTYDVASGLARFTATVGAASTVAIIASTAPEAAGTVAKSTAAQAIAGASKAALGIKATMSSILLIGAVGSGALVATSQLVRSSDGSAMEGASAPQPPTESRPEALRPEAERPADAPAEHAAIPIAERSPPPEIPPDIAHEVPVPTSPSSRGGVSARPSSTPSASSASADALGALAGASPAASSRSAASIKPEMEHLALLRRTYDPVRALALAEEGHARFPRGLFWQEREAVVISSLARLGRTADARARARAFIARHPTSFHAEELRGMLGELRGK